MPPFNQSTSYEKVRGFDLPLTDYQLTFVTIGIVVSFTMFIAIHLWRSDYPDLYHERRYRRRLARRRHEFLEYNKNEHLNFPIVPLYKTRADESIDIGTFDKKGNFIPLKFINEATDAGFIYTPSDADLIPYPELAHVRTNSSSLPSYYSY